MTFVVAVTGFLLWMGGATTIIAAVEYMEEGRWHLWAVRAVICTGFGVWFLVNP